MCKQAIERKTARTASSTENRIHLRSKHGCPERTNSLRSVSIDSSICGATEMPRPRHATTSALFYYVHYSAMWCLSMSMFVGAASASNFMSARVCRMGMRIAVNWNQRSVSSRLEPATPSARAPSSVTLQARFDFDDAPARLHAWRAAARLHFRSHEFHWRNQSNMMESKQNAKLLHLHELAKRLLFLCCLVRFRRRMSLRFCVCALHRQSSAICWCRTLSNGAR